MLEASKEFFCLHHTRRRVFIFQHIRINATQCHTTSTPSTNEKGIACLAWILMNMFYQPLIRYERSAFDMI